MVLLSFLSLLPLAFSFLTPLPLLPSLIFSPSLPSEAQVGGKESLLLFWILASAREEGEEQHGCLSKAQLPPSDSPRGQELYR